MGGIFSSSSSITPTENPTASPKPESESHPKAKSSPNMSSPDQEPVAESKTLDDSDKSKEESEENAEEEQEGECGFCVFMKGGGCKEAFVNWENCVMAGEEKGEDIVERCHEVTFQLKKCMEAHADYYEPILKAEKAAEEEVAKEMEKEKLLEGSEDNNKDDSNINDKNSDSEDQASAQRVN